VGTPPAAPGAGPHLSMADAVARAAQLHPSIAADRAAAAAAAARVDEAVAATRPQVSANAGASIQGHTPSARGDPDPRLSGGAKFSLLLPDFGRTAARRQAAEANARAAVDQVTVTGLDVRAGVESAYLLAIAQRELLDVAKDAEAAANRHLDE